MSEMHLNLSRGSMTTVKDFVFVIFIEDVKLQKTAFEMFKVSPLHLFLKSPLSCVRKRTIYPENRKVGKVSKSR